MLYGIVVPRNDEGTVMDDTEHTNDEVERKNPFDPSNPGTAEEKQAALDKMGITITPTGFRLGG